MNPNSPEHERDEMETRLTALLLGELPAQEAEAVRATLEHDPALARLHDRLARTVQLVRQAVPVAQDEAQSAPLRLSEGRRERLLGVFRTIAPRAWAPSVKREMPWFIPMGIAAALMVLVGVAGLGPGSWKLPRLASYRHVGFAQERSARTAVREKMPVLTVTGQDNYGFPTEARGDESAVRARRFALTAPPEALAKRDAPAARRGVQAPAGAPAGGLKYDTASPSQKPPTITAGTAVTAPPPPPVKPASIGEYDVAAKVPVLGDVPGLGRLYRAENKPAQQAALAEGGRLGGGFGGAGGLGGGFAAGDRLARAEWGDGAVWSFGSATARPGEKEAEHNIELSDLTTNVASAGRFDSGRSNEDLFAGVRLKDAQEALAKAKDSPAQPTPSPSSGVLTARAVGFVNRRDAQPTPSPSESVSKGVRSAGAEEGRLGGTDALGERSRLLRQKGEGIIAQDRGASDASPALESKSSKLSEQELAVPGLQVEIAGNKIRGQIAVPEPPRQRVEGLETGGRPLAPMEGAPVAEEVAQQVDAKQVPADVPLARPAPPPPVPQPEIETRENPFSTFSLNVSDVSFKLAAASLEKGQMPEPATVRSEEFINAFDYRDPEPVAGAPIAFAWDRARYPFAQNRDLLRFSVKTAATGRQPGRALNLILVLDKSGSMERADRVQIVQEALRVLAGQLQPQDKLTVITFARTARLCVDGLPGSQAGQAVDVIGSITPEGGTNLEDALNLAYQMALKHYLQGGINRVALLTDGAANLGDVDPAALKAKVEAHRKLGIALDCFGIGWEGFNDDLLEVLSRNGDGRYGFLNTPEEAADEFAAQLAGAWQAAASDVKVQVEFNPRRVTAYRQIGYAKHQLTQQQFRDNTVDAAEIGAAESGNALYVLQVNPQGQGELATVRVRYRTPGTADYHEQEWIVPDDGVAPALDQASPALRLAATAGAFSEWLASNPYAAEVRPDRLLAHLSGVPEVFGSDSRPKKLEWMIRQAQSLTGR